VHLLFAEQDCPYREENGDLRITVPRLDDYEVVVADWA